MPPTHGPSCNCSEQCRQKNNTVNKRQAHRQGVGVFSSNFQHWIQIKAAENKQASSSKRKPTTEIGPEQKRTRNDQSDELQGPHGDHEPGSSGSASVHGRDGDGSVTDSPVFPPQASEHSNPVDLNHPEGMGPPDDQDHHDAEPHPGPDVSLGSDAADAGPDEHGGPSDVGDANDEGVPDPGSLRDLELQERLQNLNLRGDGDGPGSQHDGGQPNDDDDDDEPPPVDHGGALPEPPPVPAIDDWIDPGIPENIRIPELQLSQDFIAALRDATLDDSPLDQETIHRLRNPICRPASDDLDDDLRFAIEIYLALGNGAEVMYDDIRKAILRRYPDRQFPSYYIVKKRVAELSGIHPIISHMCPASCIAYTGPYADLETCPRCSLPRYDPIQLEETDGEVKVPQRTFYTLPIGPQIQALWRSPESAERMKYRRERTRQLMEMLHQNGGVIESYEDFIDGSDYIEAVANGKIKSEDTCLVFSTDGAQLYRSKQSDCWFHIWIILEQSPDKRYKKKHIIPAGFIPGPKAPKHLDSFLFPSFHHVAAVQKEGGINVWDSSTDTVFKSNLFLVQKTADSMAMADAAGRVGPTGKRGCRVSCAVPGRHMQGKPHYYPTLLKPSDANVDGCDHPDVDPNDASILEMSPRRYLKDLRWVQHAPNRNVYEYRRRETGIVKPPLVMGLQPDGILGVPNVFSIDIMHHLSLNVPDLYISLWRGKIDTFGNDNKALWDWTIFRNARAWEEHGRRVAAVRPYLPSTFEDAPRNIAEKLTSGYKSCEHYLHLYALCPALLRGILPDKYWQHFCKLVAGARVMQQHKISSTSLGAAHELLTQWAVEFEEIYIQRLNARTHFVRQSAHLPLHYGSEITRVGPLTLLSQYPMERTIGNLGQEIKQPSNPYANLGERGLRRARVNALIAMIPELGPDKATLPRAAKDMGDGYVLMSAKDTASRFVRQCENDAIRDFLTQFNVGFEADWRPRVTRWARLRLPNDQVVRTAWKEKLKALKDVRMSRNVKFTDAEGRYRFAEVLYFFLLNVNGVDTAVAMVSKYTAPAADLLEKSYGTLRVCKSTGDTDVLVINAKTIHSVVAMVPLPMTAHEASERDAHAMYGNRFYVVEKPGLDIITIGDDVRDGLNFGED